MKDLKWGMVIIVVLVAFGFWLGRVTMSDKPNTTPNTVTTPENVTVKPSTPGRPIIKYIPTESTVDLSPFYEMIEQLQADNQKLLEWGLTGWNTNADPEPPPVIPVRPLPVPKFKSAGFGLWPGVAASLNYRDEKLSPSGYLTLQMLYVYRFTFGVQINNKEAGLNIGYHVPLFRNLQVRALVNKEFNGSSWPDNFGLGLGLNF